MKPKSGEFEMYDLAVAHRTLTPFEFPIAGEFCGALSHPAFVEFSYIHIQYVRSFVSKLTNYILWHFHHNVVTLFWQI